MNFSFGGIFIYENRSMSRNACRVNRGLKGTTPMESQQKIGYSISYTGQPLSVYPPNHDIPQRTDHKPCSLQIMCWVLLRPLMGCETGPSFYCPHSRTRDSKLFVSLSISTAFQWDRCLLQLYLEVG